MVLISDGHASRGETDRKITTRVRRVSGNLYSRLRRNCSMLSQYAESLKLAPEVNVVATGLTQSRRWQVYESRRGNGDMRRRHVFQWVDDYYCKQVSGDALCVSLDRSCLLGHHLVANVVGYKLCITIVMEMNDMYWNHTVVWSGTWASG